MRPAYILAMLDSPSIAVPGHNCWRRVPAERVAFLIDGEAYFRSLKASIMKARHSIIIVGWEFDSRTRLERDDGASQPNTIGELLRDVVRRTSTLQAHVLIWDSALIYSFDREFLPVIKHHWLSHPRLHFRLDDAHPFSASHHQKIVVIDDCLAFIGGLDISGKRWDSSQHLPDDPRRNDPAFPSYYPFHDIQVALSGPAAAALGELVRHRWRNASGRQIPAAPGIAEAPWPDHVRADVENVLVAFARTAPTWEGEPAIREVEHLFVDMIAAARQSIYIENQYFASRAIARVIARRLSEPDCPEIAMVTSGYSSGFLERNTMGASRARLQGRLQTLDRGGRLGFYAPVVEDRYVKVHAKLMVVDDRLLRIGSANMNNRSMGLDTECDFLLEAAGQPAVARAIAGLRSRLLGEHLGQPPARVEEAVRTHGLHGAIATLRDVGRRLERLSLPEPGPELLPEGELLDPDAPVETMILSAGLQPASGPRRPLAARFATGIALLAVLASLAAVWHWLPHSPWPALDATVDELAMLRDHPLAPLLVTGTFLLLGLTGIPVFLLVMAVGCIFGAWPGGLYSLLGIAASAAFSYSLGHSLGRDAVRRLTGGRASRISKTLVRHGIIAVTLLRILPVASFTAVNLMAGASRLAAGVYAAGTLIGLAPTILGFSVFGDRLAAQLKRPDALNAGLLTLLTGLLSLAAVMVFLRMTRAAPASRQEASGD